jgi:hypothetical protein
MMIATKKKQHAPQEFARGNEQKEQQQAAAVAFCHILRSIASLILLSFVIVTWKSKLIDDF